jgi:uridine kinase
VLREELVRYYTYRVWVEARRDVRMRRGLKRDGEDARDRWADWMRREDEYIAVHHPDEQANQYVMGDPG